MKSPYGTFRRVIVDPPKRTEADDQPHVHVPISRAGVEEPVVLTAKEVRAFERREARKRIAADKAPATDDAKPARGPAGTKAELASAERNVALGSAPCRLSAVEIQAQDEAATARVERVQRERVARERAKANLVTETKSPRPKGISTR